MGRLYCQCLNVVVHHSGAVEAGRLLPATALFPEQCRDPLVGQQLLELELDVAGVVTRQKALLQVRVAGDWRVHHCSNCDIDVFVTHSVKSERILLSANLVSDISALLKHKHYSPVFKLVLNPTAGSEQADEDSDLISGGSRQRFSSMTFGREDPAMKLVHLEMKNALAQEQTAMEERIRIYQEEQRKVFAQLQKRAQRERSLLFAAISRARASGISDAMIDTSTATTTATTKQQLSTGNGGSSSGGVASSSSSNSTSSNKSSPADGSGMHRVTITLQDRLYARQGVASQQRSAQDGDEGLFNFDEDLDIEAATEAEDYSPFPQSSDDDENSTDDNSFRDVSAIRNIAASLPVGVPLFTKRSLSEQHMPAKEGQIDPSDVARSIQQLALSVQDTGMFGDLPKPRINSRR